MSTTSFPWSAVGMNSVWMTFRGTSARLATTQEGDRDDDGGPVGERPLEEPAVGSLDRGLEEPAERARPGRLPPRGKSRGILRAPRGRASATPSSGVTVKDTSSDRSVAHTTVSPNSRKNWPTMSVMKAMGAKTTTSQSVMAIAARAISLRPFTAAARGSSPRAMCRSMFSRMTMESSTRMPMHSPSAMRETMFSVK